MMATNDNNVVATIVSNAGSREKSAAVAGCARAASSSAPGPPNIQKVTKMPTAKKANSLTSDSVAIASIKPSWCSVASMWRVPNSTAKVAIDSATNSAMSPSIGLATPLPGEICAMMVSSEPDTALSCSAM